MATGSSVIAEWRENPVKFVRDVFRAEPDDWQKDALIALGGDRNPQRRLSMKAATGVGKSSLLAWVGWHRLSCYVGNGEHPKGAALSINKDNLQDNLWSELAKWQKKSDLLTERFTWTKTSIYANEHPETWFLSARSFAKDADQEAIGRALSGLHSQFPFILLDETGDMPEAIGRTAEQIFTGSPIDALILAAGNPTSTNGLLYAITKDDAWLTLTITSDPEDPKRSKRISIKFAQLQIDRYGRDNPWVMATILGQFPSVGFNQLLGVEDVEAAFNRHYTEDQYSFAPMILGVDVARMGDDSSVIFPRQGLVAFKPTVYRNVKSHELARFTADHADRLRADGVIIDGTGGYGSGVIDAYELLGRHAFDCQFSGAATNPKFFNKRAEIWWLLAEWVKGGGALPRIPGLMDELIAPTYSYKGDKLILEPKDNIKARLGRSPDNGDAIAVTFSEPIQKNDLLEQYLDRMQPQDEQHHTDYDPFGG
jgi:hypothetical protein